MPRGPEKEATVSDDAVGARGGGGPGCCDTRGSEMLLPACLGCRFSVILRMGGWTEAVDRGAGRGYLFAVREGGADGRGKEGRGADGRGKEGKEGEALKRILVKIPLVLIESRGRDYSVHSRGFQCCAVAVFLSSFLFFLPFLPLFFRVSRRRGE